MEKQVTPNAGPIDKATLIKGDHKKEEPDNKSIADRETVTLYCSFCGKSQHEVVKLIAGPKTYICDECVDLCVDIVNGIPYNATGTEIEDKRIKIAVKFEEKLNQFEISVFSELVKQVENAFPSCKIDILSINNRDNLSIVTLDVKFPDIYEKNDLAVQVRALTIKLRIEQQKLIESESKRKEIEKKYSSLQDDIFPIIIDKLRKSGEYPQVDVRVMSVMFIDISGFSQMDDHDRSRNVDLLRSLGRVLLQHDKAMHFNTWGDAVVAAFDTPVDALKCGCRFMQHLNLMGMDARIGIAWGAIRISPNPIKGAFDIDGETVNIGARLESAAQIGSVICVEEIVHIIGNPNDQFYFKEVEVALKKPVAELPAGHRFPVYEVTMKPNA